MAPVYDNGSSLFPRLNTDEKLLKIMESKFTVKEAQKLLFTLVKK